MSRSLIPFGSTDSTVSRVIHCYKTVFTVMFTGHVHATNLELTSSTPCGLKATTRIFFFLLIICGKQATHPLFPQPRGWDPLNKNKLNVVCVFYSSSDWVFCCPSPSSFKSCCLHQLYSSDFRNFSKFSDCVLLMFQAASWSPVEFLMMFLWCFVIHNLHGLHVIQIICGCMVIKGLSLQNAYVKGTLKIDPFHSKLHPFATQDTQGTPPNRLLQ